MLFNFQYRRVSSPNGANTALTWQPNPDNFFFIAADLTSHDPFAYTAWPHYHNNIGQPNSNAADTRVHPKTEPTVDTGA